MSVQGTPGVLGRMVNFMAGKLGSQDRPEQANGRIARLGLSPRQQELNHMWCVYRGAQYDSRRMDWNGREVLGRVAHEVVATQGVVPPGFYDASGAGEKLPLKFRRPTAPYALIKLIVDRFSGLLFSESQHPEVKVDGDPETEDFLRAVVGSSRLWAAMMLARTYGGAMGSVAVGFSFVDGRPVVEVHDPRWCFPVFDEWGSTRLVRLEKRYRYPREVQEPATGQWVKREYWYRRVIDSESDVLYEPAEVGKGEEPEWVVARRVDHSLGFCPVVWVQNLPLQDSEDGDADVPPAGYECVEAIDALVSQANRAVLANCDPQLVLTTKAEVPVVQLGLNRALQVPDGDAKFLEVNSSGATAALEMAAELRKRVLEMAACVLEHPDVAGKTATEVERLYQSMLSRADVLREQYGTRCVVPLLEMAYHAAARLTQPRVVQAPQPTGEALEGVIHQPGATLVRGRVVLPQRWEKDAAGNPVAVDRTPGQGGTVSLKWPGWFAPTLADVQAAATAAGGAMQAGVIDDETAIGFVAPYFKVEDKDGLVEKVRANAAKRQAEEMAMMASAGQPGGFDSQQPPAPGEGALPPEGEAV